MSDVKKIKIAYLSGPVDAADVYGRWKAGRHTQLFGTSYLMQFFELCAELRADALVITTLPGKIARRQIDRVTIENRPPSVSKGLMYHLGMIGGMLALAPALFRFRPTVLVVTAHQNYWFALSFVKALGTEIIPSAHCVLWRPFATSPMHWRLLLWFDGLFLKLFVTRAMAISRVVAQQLKSLAGSAWLSVAIITPTYARGHFDQIATPDDDRRPFRILFNGRIEANKGVFDVVEVAAQLHCERPGEFVFEICGDGSDLHQLREEVRKRGLKDIVNVYGFCDKDALGRIFAISHVVIVPTRSEFEEGLAKSCVEAVLARRPFVTSPVCPALLLLSAAGVEVAPDDIPGYRDAIVRLADDPDFYRGKVEACAPLQAQFYDTGRSYKEVLKGLLIDAGIVANCAGRASP